MISLIDKGAVSDFNKSRTVIEEVPFDADIITEWPWSPVLLNEKSSWLEQKNFRAINLLVLDIDNDPASEKLSLEDAAYKFQNFKHVIGTSRNHRKEKITKGGTIKPPADRYRIILFLTRPITSIDEYKNTWKHYVNQFGLIKVADPLADLARFYLPCTYITSTKEGILLEPVPAPERNLKVEVLSNGARGRLSYKTLQFLTQQDDNLHGWHSKFIRAALDLKGKNFNFEEAAQELEKASPNETLDAEDLKQLKDVYEKRESFFKAVSIEFPEMIPIGPKNPVARPVKTSVKNLEHLITTVLQYKLFYDDRLQKIIKECKFGPHFTEIDSLKVRYHCLSYHLMNDPSAIDVVLTHEALKSSYDPLQDVFEKEPWDGKDHLEALFQTLTLNPDISEQDMYWYREFFKRWLRASAAKFYEPGSANNVLVFVGTQGKGKSRWLERLATPWPDGYKEGPIDPGNKDHALIHLEKFIWHIAELDNTTRNKDVNALKEFLTRASISERRPYARKPDTGKSIVSFCASVNSTDFLRDTSGNRRFLPIPIRFANPDHNVNLFQVFAQVASEYKAGKPWYFTNSEIEAMDYLIDMYRYKDPLMERIEERLKIGTDRLTVHEIVESALTMKDNFSTANAPYFKQAVSSLLEKKGFLFKNHSGKKVYLVDASSLKGDKLQIVN